MPEQEPILAYQKPSPESQESPERKSAFLEQEQELTPAREAEIKALVAEIKQEVGWYMKTESYQKAIKEGDLKALQEAGYLEELEGEKQDFLDRPDVKGDKRKELAVETLYEFLKLPVREIERAKRRQRKQELIERKKDIGITEREKNELKELSRQDARLNLQDAELSNKISQFLINNGYKDPEIVKDFWRTFDQLIIEEREKRKLRAGFLGPAALYYLTEYRNPQRYAFRFSQPPEDVFQSIDAYLEDKRSGEILPIQVKYCQECYSYEWEYPQDVSIIEVHPASRSLSQQAEILPKHLSQYRRSLARFAQGMLKARSPGRPVKKGLFVVIPGRLKRRDAGPVFSIDKTTAQPTESFSNWISQAL